MRNSTGSAFAAADRKSTRLNSSHDDISYAVFCLKKKKKKRNERYSAAPPTQDVAETDVRARSLACAIPRSLSCTACIFPPRVFCFFFFLNKRGPPEFSPFPLPAPFRI